MSHSDSMLMKIEEKKRFVFLIPNYKNKKKTNEFMNGKN
jgi:hypothetical protein